MTFTAWKVAVFGVFLVHIFPHLDWIQRDTEWKVSKCGKIRTRKNPNMDTFHAVFLLVVNQWVCQYLYKTSIRSPGSLPPLQKSRVIISIDLITTLGSVDCYILLPACKVEMRVKRQLFWQAGDDVRMRITPIWCGWVGITA